MGVDTAVFGPSRWKCIRSDENLGQNRGRHRILTPERTRSLFSGPKRLYKVSSNSIQIVTAGAMIDRQTDASDLIICPMLCYSNGTGQIISIAKATKCKTKMQLNHKQLYMLLVEFSLLIYNQRSHTGARNSLLMLKQNGNNILSAYRFRRNFGRPFNS